MTTGRRKWAAIPGFLAVAAATAVLCGWQGATSSQSDSVVTHDPGSPGWAYHGASSSQGFSPVQPVRFPHPLHVKALGMNCVYCHNTAYKSPDPGLPAVSTCMGCHSVVLKRPSEKVDTNPEIKKLIHYYKAGQPIPWIRIHHVPEYVHFPHMRHVNAGVTCQTCHGQIQEMYQVYQYASLNMGWCVNCHVNGYLPADGDKAAGSARTEIGPQTNVQANLNGINALPVSATMRNIGPSLADPRHRARYDCSTCHY
jgi:hypothetical protein